MASTSADPPRRPGKRCNRPGKPSPPPFQPHPRLRRVSQSSQQAALAGGPAYGLGCKAFEGLSWRPGMWRPYKLAEAQCDEMGRLTEKYGLSPLVIHTSYLVNVASTTTEFLKKSILAFRGEVERALAL